MLSILTHSIFLIFSSVFYSFLFICWVLLLLVLYVAAHWLAHKLNIKYDYLIYGNFHQLLCHSNKHEKLKDNAKHRLNVHTRIHFIFIPENLKIKIWNSILLAVQSKKCSSESFWIRFNYFLVLIQVLIFSFFCVLLSWVRKIYTLFLAFNLSRKSFCSNCQLYLVSKQYSQRSFYFSFIFVKTCANFF